MDAVRGKPPLFLPFRPDMAQAVRDGRKTCTSRTKRYGRAGDVLHSDAGGLRLTRVHRRTLGWVSVMRFDVEGFVSGPHFEGVWAEIHPRAGWTPDKKVWVHEFEYVGALIPQTEGPGR